MAGIKSFVKQIDPGNRDVTQTQSNVNSAVQQIANSPIIDGVIVKDVSFAGDGDIIVSHKLGREPLGFIVIGQKSTQPGGSIVSESTTVNNNRDKFLLLHKYSPYAGDSAAGSSSVTEIITLWVF